MGVLQRKLRRDLWQRKGQLSAVILTVFLGIVLFAASYDAFLNLQASYRSLYQDLRFADFTIQGGDPRALTQAGGDLSGVEAVATRKVADVPLQVAGGRKLLGRVVGLPATGQPEVDRVMVVEGSYLSPGGQPGALMEQHMADHFGVRPGDQVQVLRGDTWQKLSVAGIVASPEYLWPARDRQEVLTSPDDFGVIFAPESFLESLPPGATRDETLYFYGPGADTAALDARLTALAREQGAGAAYTRAEQASNAALQEDVQGFSDLSFMFPLLFLGAAGMATYVLLTRVVYSQQGIIGLLRAAGFSRRQIFAHYLGYGLFVGLGGAIPGVLVGLLLGRLITGFYTDAISVPVTVLGFHPVTIILGPVFGLVAGSLSALAPSLRAGRMAPGVAMRGTLGAAGGASLLERIFPPLRRLPARGKMVLRGIGRNKRRSLSTVLGVVLALVLILVSWGMIDTVQILVSRQFDQVQRQDAQIYFAPGTAEAALARVRSVPGVAAAEPAAEVPVVLATPTARYSTRLIALPQDTEMHEFLLAGDGSTPLPTTGLLAGVALENQLGVRRGDEVTVSLPGGATSFTEPLAGFVNEPLGTLAYMSLEGLAGATGTSEQALVSSLLVRYEPGADRGAMRTRLTELPGVTAFVDSQALAETVRSYMGLFYAFVGIMLAFGGVMAFALIFNTMSANISERATEIATLKAAGVGRRTITGLITSENVLLTLVAIGPGLLLGYLAAWFFMATYNSDLFRFDLHVRPTTFVFSGLVILLVALLSQWPILRVVRRLDVAKVVRERGV